MTRLDELLDLRIQVDRLIELERSQLAAMGKIRDDVRRVSLGAPPDPDVVVGLVSALLDVPADGVKGPSGGVKLVRARHVVFWVLYESGMPYKSVGRALGRDHTTVMNGVRRVDDSRELVAAGRRVQALLEARDALVDDTPRGAGQQIVSGVASAHHVRR